MLVGGGGAEMAEFVSCSYASRAPSRVSGAPGHSDGRSRTLALVLLASRG